MRKITLFSCILFLLAGTSVAIAQNEEHSAEISTSVPELANFHKIIFPMWHKAYPAKDTATLRKFVPEIKENMAKINAAKLPGILRDKEELWKNELAKFNTVAENYYKACESKDMDTILKAAEKFHSAYEGMNRVIKPFVKEMDTYHKTLYVIYHKMLPENQFNEIASVMDQLIAEADAITKFPQDQLAKRLKDNTPKYYTISKELYDATVNVKKVLEEKNNDKSRAAIEQMHKTYQKLESVFE